MTIGHINLILAMQNASSKKSTIERRSTNE